MMHEQAMLEDLADTPADRWSAFAYVITALGLAGIGVAIFFLAIGRVYIAELIGFASWAVVLLPTSFANVHGRPSASNSDGSPESRNAFSWGWFAAYFMRARRESS